MAKRKKKALPDFINNLVDYKDEFFKEFIDNFGDVMATCEKVGISYQQYINLLTDPTFEDGVKMAREILLNKVEASAFKSAINGNTKSQQFMLKSLDQNYKIRARDNTDQWDGPPVISFHIPEEPNLLNSKTGEDEK